MSKITYQTESFKAIVGDLKEIIAIHHKELGVYNDRISLEVMWEKYFSLEDAGVLHVLTARDGDKLIGYYISMVYPHLHYASELFSINDILFIHPDYRKGFTGIKLLKEAEKQMRNLGVTVISLGFKTYAPFDKILDRLGWDFTEKIYTKYLGEK